MPGAMGSIPLSWQELRAWADMTEARMSPGDMEALRDLSSVFVAAAAEFTGKVVPAPYGFAAKAPEDVQAQIHRAMGMLMERKS